ncbi:hypothetical protein DMC47_35710 [Nostoc sp. 3335mG]|nr:hypothetical protein DMC47_35710 [Nostoc sp. 3335mG]
MAFSGANVRSWSGRSWFWAAAGALFWAVRYVAFVGHRPTVPWTGWFDQSRYIGSATAFAHLDLSTGAHWYPLAYPLLACPFVALMPRDPFLPIDLILFVATLLGFQRATRVLGFGPLPSGLVFLLTALAQGKVAKLWIEPWTSTLSAALVWWMLALAAERLAAPDSEAPRPRDLFLIGLFCGALPAVRPVDALMSGIVGLVLLALLIRRRQLGLRTFGALAGGALLVPVLYLALHLAIYGPRFTDYMVAAAKTGFVLPDLGWKAYVLLVTAAPWFPDARTIGEALPWTVPGFAGVLASIFGARSGSLRAWALILGVGVFYVLMLLSYADLLPTGLWHYNNAHYFKWLFPLLGIGIVALVRMLTTAGQRKAVLAALAVTALLVSIRIVPQLVAPDVPARMLMFPAVTGGSWDDIYFADARLSDRAGSLVNVSGFHQIPDDGRVRAIAIQRSFAADPMLAQPGEAGRAPIARYGEHVSIGLPCWFRRSACTIR